MKHALIQRGFSSRTFVGRPVAVWLMVLLLGSTIAGLTAGVKGQESRAELRQTTRDGADAGGGSAGEDAAHVESLIQQLDAEQFAERNEATRQLVGRGPGCLPQLIDSLASPSREIRFRVAEILRNSFPFDSVAPLLVEAVSEPYGLEARSILRHRAMRQVEESADLENTEKLFQFWNTSLETLRRRVTFDLAEAQGRDQVASVVAPLIGLREKARVFDSSLSRLNNLSLNFDHQHSPGHVIAQTLAHGLLVDDQQAVRFAQGYIAALTVLVDKMETDGQTGATVRKEVADRANMSDGATFFVTRTLDANSNEHEWLINRLGIDPAMLKEEFLRGLETLDTRECYRRVGKVHIADMLLEALSEWPEAPRDGFVQSVVDCAVTTIGTGDKPKALALLDALDGCADLEEHGMSVREGLGEQLAKRLCMASLAAPNNRACHPVRAIHDRILRAVKAGVTAQSDLFPHELVDDYLLAKPESISDESRLVLGRYVNLLQEVRASGLDFAQPAVHDFLLRMKESLKADRDVLKRGLAHWQQLTVETKHLDGAERAKRLEQELADWLVQPISPSE
jgi:hypothetical protein